jgi:energy-coupling factor transporter ATP-binding protein EcfA2
MGLRRTKKNMPAIRRSIGCLFNPVEYQFIMPDLANDIMLSIPGPLSVREKYKAALEWLKKFNLEKYASCSPLELSSGEMKRAALATVIARVPDVLLLDEPLNNIDRKAALELIEILASMKQTMIIATHRLLIAKQLATHIALMKDGMITDYCTAQKGLAQKTIRNILL